MIKYCILTNSQDFLKQTLKKIIDLTGFKLCLKKKHMNTDTYARKYIDSILNSNFEKSPDFVEITQEQCKKTDNLVKLIAFYLPQFHSIPINNQHHGRGFTDWNNVTKAIPQYTGHYQPKLPTDLGFYNLNDVRIMKQQAEIAKLYGLYGFCFHYYWFSGARLLETPIFNWLNDKTIKMPFCLCWANENWSKLWDGGDKELIQKQQILEGDDEKFFNDILPFFVDERYIKIGNKPVLIIYRPDIFEKEIRSKFISKLRELTKKNGFDDLYLIMSEAFGVKEPPENLGFDGVVEFPPHGMRQRGFRHKKLKCFINPKYKGNIMDLQDYIENKKYLYKVDYKLFKTVFPSWDNSARKAYSNGLICHGATPELYKSWLNDCIKYTKEHNNQNEQLVFINAWNEWAEGAYLEPDTKYGYAYLQATKEVLEEN